MTDIYATVAGQKMLTDGFEISSGTYGSVGHGTISTSRALLTSVGLDLFGIAAAATSPVEVNVIMDGTKLFGGELVDTEWEYDRDKVEIHVRDWAGVLVDQKRILTDLAVQITNATAPFAPGQLSTLNVQVENQTLSSIITKIATTFGLTPVLHLTQGGAAYDPVYGAVNDANQNVFISTPQSLWTLLNQLAKDTGYEVYVTPNKELVFGAPGAGLTPLNLVYNQALADATRQPCKELRIKHNPRRNSTFRVLVLSYDVNAGQTVIGRATVIGSGFAGINGQLAQKGIQQSAIAQGLYVGSAALAADTALEGKSEVGNSEATTQVQLYTFNIDGLTQLQATQRAQGIATDIMRREMSISCEIDGYAAMLPTTRVTVAGAVDASVAGRTFFVHAYTHHFMMPKSSGGKSSGGIITMLRGMNYPGGGGGE